MGESNSKKDIEENTNTEKQDETSNKGMPIRTYLVMAIAGAYVVYLGYSLCAGVVKGEQGSSTGFLVAGIAFIILGGAFVINGLRGYMRVKKEQKEQAALAESIESASLEPTEGEEDVLSENESVKTETAGEAHKKMSIADRANLVRRMEEEDKELLQDVDTSDNESDETENMQK